MDFTVRPITPDEIDRVPLRCWPDRSAIAKLFMSQETIGMAAWDGNRCIAQLHCYRIDCPDDLVSNWPRWNRPWWTESVQKSEVNLQFPAWCHACFHVGRSLQTAQEEVLELVHRFAQQSKWDVDRVHSKLNLLDAVYLSRKEVENAVHELFISKRDGFDTEAPEYRGRGIGTAMCQESIRWATNHGCAVVVGSGVPSGIPVAANHEGALPWTTYARLGFRNKLLQLIVDDHAPIRQAKENALKSGRSAEDICHRMMVFDV